MTESDVFSTHAGIHQQYHGLYQSFRPKILGQKSMEITLSHLSGRHGIRGYLESQGIDPTPESVENERKKFK